MDTNFFGNNWSLVIEITISNTIWKDYPKDAKYKMNQSYNIIGLWNIGILKTLTIKQYINEMN